ncbi:MAG TPA: Zn-dependent hydrolase [Bacillus sp. (in: firmicutes)]|nr:Zn-dependent hydrolase [Bacillus sp. (in: firmicutes)]
MTAATNIFSKERLVSEVNKAKNYPAIDPVELAEKLSALAAIGATKEGGISRHPYTEEEKQAKALFKGWMQAIGLRVREDHVGNLFGVLEGEDPSLPAVMTGSHLDSVPNGGAFDGPLGCLSSLLAVEAFIKQGIKLKRSIEVVVFVDEEGSRFKNGLFGSRVLMGEVTPGELDHFYDEEGTSMLQAMKEQGYEPEQMHLDKRTPEDIYAFIELHIEQGKILESEGKNIGIVNGIAGASWRTYTFLGSTDHAGNTPMHMRKDTVAAAAEFILEVEKLPRTYSDTAVATVGGVTVFPNGTNVIAGKTEVVVDARDIHEESRNRMVAEMVEKAKEIARKREIEVKVDEGIAIPPVMVPDRIQQTIAEAAERNGLSTRVLPSGAGHDAMIVGRHVPSGMIFVPSHNGKSHSPEEWTSLPDCVNGIQVLKETLEQLANE